MLFFWICLSFSLCSLVFDLDTVRTFLVSTPSYGPVIENGQYTQGRVSGAHISHSPSKVYCLIVVLVWVVDFSLDHAHVMFILNSRLCVRCWFRNCIACVPLYWCFPSVKSEGALLVGQVSVFVSCVLLFYYSASPFWFIVLQIFLAICQEPGGLIQNNKICCQD